MPSMLPTAASNSTTVSPSVASTGTLRGRYLSNCVIVFTISDAQKIMIKHLFQSCHFQSCHPERGGHFANVKRPRSRRTSTLSSVLTPKVQSLALLAILLILTACSQPKKFSMQGKVVG